jgi:hypothetical protein
MAAQISIYFARDYVPHDVMDTCTKIAEEPDLDAKSALRGSVLQANLHTIARGPVLTAGGLAPWPGWRWLVGRAWIGAGIGSVTHDNRCAESLRHETAAPTFHCSLAKRLLGSL